VISDLLRIPTFRPKLIPVDLIKCEGERYWDENVKCKYLTKTTLINVQKLTSWNLINVKDDECDTCKTTIMKILAEKSCKMGCYLTLVLRRLYPWAFVKQVKTLVHVSVSYLCNPFAFEIPHRLFWLDKIYGLYFLTVGNTGTIDKLQVVNLQIKGFSYKLKSYEKRSKHYVSRSRRETERYA
jgi:hypothetical protein